MLLLCDEAPKHCLPKKFQCAGQLLQTKSDIQGGEQVKGINAKWQTCQLRSSYKLHQARQHSTRMSMHMKAFIPVYNC